MKWSGKREWWLVIYFIAFIAPLLYHHTTLYFYYPDIQYVKAKILWVAAGDFYSDPVTGAQTFHPPYYHMFLALVTKMGIGIRWLLYAITILNLGLIFYFIYQVVRRMFDDTVAFWLVLLTPFIFKYMGPTYPYLPGSFNFSIPFYLAGLWLYVKSSPETISRVILTSVLWGLAFLISPVYLFLIGFTLAYELLFVRNMRISLIRSGVFLITIIPFFIQAATVYSAGMIGTDTFSLWPGVPSWDWLQGFVCYLTLPGDPENLSWLMALTSALIAIGLYSIWKSRPVRPLVYITLLAYLFTAYHFKPQYSNRILLFVSILLLGYTIHQIIRYKRLRLITITLMAALAGFGLMSNLVTAHNRFISQAEEEKVYLLVSSELKGQIGNYIPSGSTVMATDNTYLHFIMPMYRIHSLVAYRSGEYFQIGTALARGMLNDYNTLMNATDMISIDRICDKYDITAAVAGTNRDMKYAGFQTISKYWNLVYQDNYFRIYKRPNTSL